MCRLHTPSYLGGISESIRHYASTEMVNKCRIVLRTSYMTWNSRRNARARWMMPFEYLATNLLAAPSFTNINSVTQPQSKVRKHHSGPLRLGYLLSHRFSQRRLSHRRVLYRSLFYRMMFYTRLLRDFSQMPKAALKIPANQCAMV